MWPRIIRPYPADLNYVYDLKYNRARQSEKGTQWEAEPAS